MFVFSLSVADTRSHSAGVINSVDFAVQKFDRFRSRVGSIVRPPSGYHPLLSPGQSLNQQASCNLINFFILF